MTWHLNLENKPHELQDLELMNPTSLALLILLKNNPTNLVCSDCMGCEAELLVVIQFGNFATDYFLLIRQIKTSCSKFQLHLFMSFVRWMLPRKPTQCLWLCAIYILLLENSRCCERFICKRSGDVWWGRRIYEWLLHHGAGEMNVLLSVGICFFLYGHRRLLGSFFHLQVSPFLFSLGARMLHAWC